MATTLKTKNSVTTTVVPTTLQQGELAVNITDKKLWVGNAATTPIQIAGAGTTGNAAGSNTQVQYNSSGSFAGDADFTFNGTTVTMANDASISGLTVGKGGGAVASNTAIGVNALTANEAGGTNNTAIGNAALDENTTGDANTAIGRDTLTANTTASNNTAVGYVSLRGNTTGANNTSVGMNSMADNTTGSTNTALGYRSLISNTTASNNTAIGADALLSNTTASNNTAVGYTALYSNTTGATNTAVGYQALNANTTGTLNVAMGDGALGANTTGGSNAAFGSGCLSSNTTASNNTGIGRLALNANTTGAENTAVGRTALQNATTGSGNTVIGEGSGNAITTGGKNTIVGRYSGNNGGLDIRTASNHIVLSDGDGVPQAYCNGASGISDWNFGVGGTASAETGSIKLNGSSASGWGPRIQGYANGSRYWQVGSYSNIKGGGDQFITCMNTSGGVYLNGASATSWSSASDERLKENLTPIENGLNKVASLRAVIGNYTSDDNKVRKPFLIAQDVQAVLPEAVGYSRQSKEDETEYLSLAYTEVIPLLVSAIKELKAEVDSLKAQLNK